MRKNNKNNKKLLPWWQIIILDILALGVSLCVFSLFHHVIPYSYDSTPKQLVDIPSNPQPNQTNNDKESKYTPTHAGDFTESFPDYDTGAGKDHSYQSDNIRIAIDGISENGVTYYVADVWVRDISYLKTALAHDKAGMGIIDTVKNIAKNNNAIFAVSGDYYGARARGIVIRNGNLYREKLFEDVAVLYQNGILETIPKNAVDLDKIEQNGAYQAWSFGPLLLKDGQAIEDIKSGIGGLNPRCAIGYYQPGHYCFVLVDGRQPGHSRGMTMVELSRLMSKLGCETAYNLDGGQTAAMVFKGEFVNKPYKGGRDISDIVFVGE